MKLIEILNLNRELISNFQKAGVRLDDVRYIDLYNEYRTLAEKGEKVSYIVACLADKYGICERKVYSLLKRYKSECNALIFGGVNPNLRLWSAATGRKMRCTAFAA
jgi:hypothetical protein